MKGVMSLTIPAMGLLLALPGAARANNPNPGVAPPGSNAYGKSDAEWSAEWFKWLLKIPVADHPALGGACTEGQSGKVFNISADFTGAPSVSCTIPAGKAVFFPIVNVECSTAEAAPFHGDNAEELHDCAACWGDQIAVSSLAATLDGVPLSDLGNYRAVSPMFTFEYPEDNIFGIPDGPGTGQSVADGYWIMLGPLSAGEHTLSFGGLFVFATGDECGLGAGEPVSFGFGGSYVLTVEGGN
jgi:hypothetical protein